MANEFYSGISFSWQGGQTGILYTDRRNFYLDPMEVSSLFPSVAPFVTFTGAMGVETLPDPDFKLFEEDDTFVNQKFYINDAAIGAWSDPGSGVGAPGATVTAAGVDNNTAIAIGSNLEGMEVEIRDGSTGALKAVALITDYNTSTGAVTFKNLGKPGASGNVADALADNDVVYIITSARAEGTRSPEGWSSQPYVKWNSAQIEKTPFEITGTLYEAALRGYSSEFARLQMLKAKEHKIQQERKFLMGWRVNGNEAPLGHLTDADGKPIRTTMGIVPMFLEYGDSSSSSDTQNVFSIDSSTYQYDNFVDDTAKIFQYAPASGRLTAFCGPLAYSYWSKVGTAFLNPTVTVGKSEVGTLGYHIRSLETPNGIIDLVYNPLLRGPYSGHMIIVEDGTVKKGVYRNPQYQTAIQENDFDGQKDQYFSDEGLIVKNLRKNSLMIIS